MSDLWIPQRHQATNHGFPPLLDEIRDDPNWFKVASSVYNQALSASFATDRGQDSSAEVRATEREIRRRMTILFDWTRRLRHDHKYSLPRIFTTDVLTLALKAELKGEDFEPSDRSTWRRPNPQGENNHDDTE